MPRSKILILNSCCHKTAPRLCSIIESNINCDVQILEGHPGVPSLVNQWHPDLILSIEDEPATHRTSSITELSDIQRILVLCHQGSEKQVLDLPMDQMDDFIITPFRECEVICRIKRLIGQSNRDEKELAKKNILQKLGLAQLIGQDPAFLEVISKIPLISDCDASVLLTGETGVGKEVCARAIHYLSERSDKPFIPVSCGAIPTNLVENELFGHRRGAFTDARNNQLGMISEAESGTLFLDEIDTLSMEAQSKLLRLLQDNIYRPLGHTKYVRANIRVIAATNVDLRQKIQESNFRADLFYRLNVVSLHLPPLRERKTDITLLAHHFLKKYKNEYGRKQKSLSPAAVRKLLLYDWPGNIRELENVIQQAMLLTTVSVIPPENINIGTSIQSDSPERLSFREAKKRTIERFEKEYITELLISCEGNITRAARKAKKDRRDFGRLVQKYHLDAESFHSTHS